MNPRTTTTKVTVTDTSEEEEEEEEKGGKATKSGICRNYARITCQAGDPRVSTGRMMGQWHAAVDRNR